MQSPKQQIQRLRTALRGLLPQEAPWVQGNQLTLLQGTAEFFPALVQAMQGAQNSIYFETYIFDLTASGAEVAQALLQAAERGVQVRVVVDGIGTGALAQDWQQRFTAAGVQLRVFSPPGRWFFLVRKQWQRLHRKLCAIDGRIAFCGGINVLDDFHDPNHGALDAPRLDFAVRMTGPVAASVERTCAKLWQRLAGHETQHATQASPALEGIDTRSEALVDVVEEPAAAALVLRDNLRQRRHIERAYLQAIARAEQEIIIVNAYFFPSRRLKAALIRAARRGVQVRLLLQGRYEYFLQYHASRPMYETFVRAGVQIYEYQASFLHAKVAVIDALTDKPWATVGSSNLDPLSLLLAREANIVTVQPAFARELHQRLQKALEGEHPISLQSLQQRPLRTRIFDWLAYYLARTAVWIVKDRF